eukprot:5275308-Pyramimonas_sp.AAC.1
MRRKILILAKKLRVADTHIYWLRKRSKMLYTTVRRVTQELSKATESADQMMKLETAERTQAHRTAERDEAQASGSDWV